MKTNKEGIPFGIETLKQSVMRNCQEHKGCFNPDDCSELITIN